MRFAVDAHAIGRQLTGNETYIRNLLKGFAALDGDSEFIAYVCRDEAEARIPERFRIARVSANPFLRLGWDLPARLRKDRPDLLHVQYTAPLLCNVPIVVTVHDVSYLDRPEFFSKTRSLQLRATVAGTVRRAASILTPSEFSRKAIARAYNISEETIKVVPNGIASSFRPVPQEAAIRRVRESFDLHIPFILTVGDLQPRKNQIGLIAAFAELLRARPSLPHHLVFAGKATWHAAKVYEAARKSGVADRIKFLGFVSDNELRELYGACDLFVFPSFYEGFGLPILEAMACGRAVACSNSSAIPEVADAAALLFDPNSIPQMTRAMLDLLIDPELRARMERLGLANSSRFSWDKAAARTLDAYYRVARRGTMARAASVLKA